MPVGTTIAEFGSNTVSLATLAALISQLQSQQQNTGGGNIGNGSEGTLVPGPGLAGGGVLIGNVPIRLVAPIPWGLEGGGGEDGDSGPPGVAGAKGATGGPGATGATGPPGAILVYVNTTVPAGNTVTNTSSETFFASSYSVPAGSLAIGTVLRVKFFGIYSTGVVAPSLILRVYFGATILIASGTLTTVAGVTNDGWSAEGLFTVQTIGASGTIEAQGLSEFSTASTAVLFVNMDNTAPITVDTTIAEIVRASVQWGGTVNASDTITLREMTVEVMSVIGISAPPPPPPFAVLFGEDGEEGMIGPRGLTGATGPQGPAGGGSSSQVSTPMFFGEDGEDGLIGPPGPQGAAGTGGGGSNPFNVTPLTHPAGVQPFLANDNFEQANGTAVDTAGTRYTGATAWTWLNQGASVAVQQSGSLVMTPDTGTPRGNFLQQPVHGSTWAVQCQITSYNNAGTDGGGLFVRDSVSGRIIVFQTYFSTNILIQALDNPSTFNSNVYFGGPALTIIGTDAYPLFFQVTFDGTTLSWNYSISGIPGTFHVLATQAAATFLGTAPTHWGLVAGAFGSNTVRIVFDQFVQTA